MTLEKLRGRNSNDDSRDSPRSFRAFRLLELPHVRLLLTFVPSLPASVLFRSLLRSMLLSLPLRTRSVDPFNK